MSEELNEGNRLATALVDHLDRMGNASSCVIPVLDRAEEMVVVVCSSQEHQELERMAKALDWLNTVDGMDWFSCCDYGDATLTAIETAMKGQTT